MNYILFVSLAVVCTIACVIWNHRSEADRAGRRRTLRQTLIFLPLVIIAAPLYTTVVIWLQDPVPVEQGSPVHPMTYLLLAAGGFFIITGLLLKAGWVKPSNWMGYSSIGAVTVALAFTAMGIHVGGYVEGDALFYILGWAVFLIGNRVHLLEKRLSERTMQLEQTNADLATANEQVRETTRLKSEFLARMSHDLRTPMNAIIGYTRLLLRKSGDVLDARQYSNLENIQTSANNLLELINDILDLSKIESGRIEIQPQKVDPDVLVRECTAAIQPLLQDGVEIKTDVDYEGTLMSDPDRLRRGLMNLLGNAVKFTQSGSVTATLRRDEGETVLSVADTGVGIAADELPHIFDEFRQVARKGSSAQEGTGLGLAIVKRSVELIGGRVSVDSVEGEGTMFTIRVRDLQPQGEAA
ncbi:MAG: hypothetical protein HOM68_13960 [Gemmatimonadetes bacterium]|jgi:signal transduction histidine kinase|nr:hypothetical protein [Gemmatimonadota bacterium]MBT5057644.1 hypothetical protein [Gemmatimonadota bacterium]MBT5146152.1 hypothetical protein [Gemmatimonadota bacterium]MBT5587598.1 hypothetical protein [Gemmatimonadota bacterium]MBT5963566.1 hypothetical protein [Gemmatimonadota bacterium]